MYLGVRYSPLSMNRTIISLLTIAAAGSVRIAGAQTQAIPFLDDSTVQTINLTMDPADLALLQQNYLLDTYYHGTFTWNGITENIGIRQHGGGSRSPIKPNLDLNFAKYDSTQTFLGLPFIMIKANNEDPSNLREWLSMKLFRMMGLPAPREAPAQVLLNGQILGFYFIVEHEDETFLQRNFGENGGYLYEWEQNGSYGFNNLGTDPAPYAPLLDLKTSQPTADLQNFTNLVQIVNQPSSPAFTDDQFIAALSAYLNPGLFLNHIATEAVLSEADGICGGMVGMNNFYLYQFQNQTLYQMIPWDKDFTFWDPTRDILYGITTGANINLLAQRLVGIPQYRTMYLNAVAKAQSLLGGAGGWGDQQITTENSLIYNAATNDPNKQCINSASVLAPCGAADFIAGVQWDHAFLIARSPIVQAALAADGYVPAAPDPQIQSNGVAAWGATTQNISPGSWATITGTGLGTALQAPGGIARILGGTFVSVEGVRAPLSAVAADTIQFLVPSDLAPGSASIAVSNNGAMTNTVAAPVVPETPNILAVVHANWTIVSQTAPVVPGETLVIYVTGLGALNGNLAIDAVGPSSVLATTVDVPQVFVGSTPLTVYYSGLAPGFFGLYQVNATVPPTWVSAGVQTSVSISAGGQSAIWQAGQ
jgi:uncharacterized protein (TIGR03437 family)